MAGEHLTLKLKQLLPGPTLCCGPWGLEDIAACWSMSLTLLGLVSS